MTPGKPTKIIAEELKKKMLKDITTKIKAKEKKILPLERMPDKILRFFLGKVNNGDITGIAVFAIVNGLSINILKIILETIKYYKANTFNQRTTELIEKKIKALNEKIIESQNVLGIWKLAQEKATQQNMPAIPRPETLKYFSFNIEKKATYNIMGEKLHKGLVERLTQEISTQSYNNPTDVDINYVDIQMEELKKLRTITFRLKNGEFVVKKVIWKFQDENNVSITIK